jgi:hypothetical protein
MSISVVARVRRASHAPPHHYQRLRRYGDLVTRLRRHDAGRSRRRDRVALATWSSPAAARITARLQIDRDDLKQTFPGIAPVAAIGWAIAQGLAHCPSVNRRVALYGLRTNQTVRISFAVNVGSDLQVAIIDDADQLTPRTTQRALVTATRAARAGDGPFTKATTLLSLFPVMLSRPVLRGWSLLSAGFGVKVFGFGAAPFGAALISSVAVFDLDAVDAPFVPFARCALVVSIGASDRRAVARNDVVEARDIIDLVVTADHRVCDGAQFAAFAHYVLTQLGQPRRTVESMHG